MRARMWNVSGWSDLKATGEILKEVNSNLVESGFKVLNFVEHYFDPHGYTAMWLLAESHFAVHTFPEEDTYYWELSSCVEEFYRRYVALTETDQMHSWGHHLLLDCERGDMASITSKENVKAFVDHLVDAIDMVAYGDTWIEHFATHDPDKAGLSMFQMIETSNISGHFVDKNGNFYLDVFSCKTFDEDTVIRLVNQYFSPEKIKKNMVKRG